ncbi:MAG: hypothetical protein AAF533_06200 [Acidobacteriota bacterium]
MSHRSLSRSALALLLVGVILCLAGSRLLAGEPLGILLPGTQPNDGTGDPDFPEFLNERQPGMLKDVRECVPCHVETTQPSTEEEVWWIGHTWQGSMMANAARDPMFWAALDIANQDDAALGDVDIGDFCLRCHVPSAWYEGRSHCDTPYGEMFDGACITGEFHEPGDDTEGITCHFCHRMYDASNPPNIDHFEDPNAPYVGNAQIYLALDPDEIRGPYDDAQTFFHPWTQDQLFLSPQLCGQCHQVTNPLLNRVDPDTGADLGYLMPIERTYSEWQQSVYSDEFGADYTTCQQCHMPEVDIDGDGNPDPARACRFDVEERGPGGTYPGEVRNHGFIGANAWMLGVILEEYGFDLEREAQLVAGVERSLDLLRNRTADLTMTAPATVQAGDDLAVDVRVVNQTGHKLPTGYPEGRRMFLNVRAGVDTNGDGELTPDEVATELGYWNPETGDLDEGGTKVYELEIGVFNLNGTGECDHLDPLGQKVFHFVRNNCITHDNRIPPLGFVPDAETAPVGYTYPDNPMMPGTLANYDDTAISLPIPDVLSGEILVESRFFYQTTSKEYIEFLLRENRSTCDPRDGRNVEDPDDDPSDDCDPTVEDPRPNRSEKLYDMWERHGRSAPVLVAIDSATVDVTPAPTGGCCFGSNCYDGWIRGQCEAELGTYQGDDSTCGGVVCIGSFDPRPGEASHGDAGSPALRVVDHAEDGRITFDYTPACDASDHAVVWGRLPDLRTPAPYQGFTCGFGVNGRASLQPPLEEDLVFFLVVGRSPGSEGSYGQSSAGDERPEAVALAPCDLIQQPGPSCDGT